MEYERKNPYIEIRKDTVDDVEKIFVSGCVPLGGHNERTQNFFGTVLAEEEVPQAMEEIKVCLLAFLIFPENYQEILAEGYVSEQKTLLKNTPNPFIIKRK